MTTTLPCRTYIIEVASGDTVVDRQIQQRVALLVNDVIDRYGNGLGLQIRAYSQHTLPLPDLDTTEIADFDDQDPSLDPRLDIPLGSATGELRELLVQLAEQYEDHPGRRPCCDSETTLRDWVESGLYKE